MNIDEDKAVLRAAFLAQYRSQVAEAIQEYQDSAQRRADAENEFAQMLREAPDLDTLADQLWDKALGKHGTA